jgi:hypothetical protein
MTELRLCRGAFSKCAKGVGVAWPCSWERPRSVGVSERPPFVGRESDVCAALVPAAAVCASSVTIVAAGRAVVAIVAAWWAVAIIATGWAFVPLALLRWSPAVVFATTIAVEGRGRRLAVLLGETALRLLEGATLLQ